MKTHLEVTIVLCGENEVVYGESQKLFDMALELEPSVMKSISYDYFNLEDEK